MKLRTLVDNVHGRYEVQVETFGFTANETEQMANFGEPLVEVGGAFSGTVSRPGVSNTVISITGDGANATAVPIVQNGVVTGATVTSPGTGYTAASVAVAGDGVGATAHARYTVTDATITAAPPGIGTGFVEGDILTLSGAPGDEPVQIEVDTVSVGGGVQSATILNRGNFTTVPTDPAANWTTNGAGINFTFAFSWGVGQVVIDTGGSGYNVTPLTVSFTLPTSTRRLRSDSPSKQVFDLEDDPDSDAKAKVWGDTIVARCLAAKNTLMARTSPFEGETVITG